MEDANEGMHVLFYLLVEVSLRKRIGTSVCRMENKDRVKGKDWVKCMNVFSQLPLFFSDLF